MPERIYFPHQFGGESADLDHIVPSLGEMEFDEACIIQMMDHNLPKADNPRLHHIQDAVFCEPLPMSPAAMGMQDGIAYYPKYRSHSTGGDSQAEYHLPCSMDDPQTSFLQELMQTGSMTDVNGTIPIYSQSLNSSGLPNTPTASNTPSTSKAYNIPQLQDTAGNLSSLLFSDLFNNDCPSVLDGFPSQPPVPAGNSAIIDDWGVNWGQLQVTALPQVDTTNTQAIPATKTTHNYNSVARAPIGRMSSLPVMKYDEADDIEIAEAVMLGCNIMDNCNPMVHQQSSSLPRTGSIQTVKKLPHRRTSSDTNLVKFLSVGTHNPQLLPNETFMSTVGEQTQHKPHRSPKRKQPRKNPYPIHTTQVSVNSSINISHTAMSSGVHNTPSFTPLSYPAMNSINCSSSNSPRVIHSRSVPSSPSIHRVAEPLQSAAGFRQQLSSSHCGTAPTSASKFTFENIALTATPTRDLNTGTSQEARDEKEKTEAFSRLHQGLHLWEFLMEILLTNEYQPILKWTDKENGIFKIVDSEALARFWGEYRRKPKMNYDKMSRAIRYYYGKDILDKAPKRLYYQFKYHSHWWEKLQKVDPSFKINHIPVSNIPAPSVQDLIIPDDL